MKKYNVEPNLSPHSNEILFGDPDNRAIETALIGRLAESGRNRNVYFDISGERVVGIFGKRGSGKSYTLGSILESMCTAEEVSTIGTTHHSHGYLLFDTLNIFWTLNQSLNPENEEYTKVKKILNQWRISTEELNVDIWIPNGYRTDLTPDYYKDFTIEISSLDADDLAGLINVSLFQDRMGQLLNEAWNKVVIEGWIDTSGEYYPPEGKYTFDEIIDCLQNDSEIINFYQRDTIRALSQRLKFYSRQPLFGKVGVTLNELIKKGRLSVLLLNQLSDEVRRVLTAVVMRRLLNERSIAAENTKRLRIDNTLNEELKDKIIESINKSVPPTWIIIDEAQNVLPAERSVQSTDVIVKFVREGRNHGLSFMLTTQQPSAIDQRIMAQLDTLICHKLTVQSDIETVLKNNKTNNPASIKYNGSELTSIEWIRSLDRGQALISNAESVRNFVIDIRPRISPHGGSEN